MRFTSIFLIGAALLLAKTDITQYTSIGNVALTISNFGMLGNGFRVYDEYDENRDPVPSFEYPIGSGTEHLYRAGLWVGAITTEGDTLVTTGVCDATSASAGSEGFEFYPTSLDSDTVIEKSTLLTSPFYDPEAISEQDFDATYYDYTSPHIVPNHNPLHIKVHQRSFAWSYPFADDFVIISFTIYNQGEGVLSQLYLGIYAELVTGNRGFWGDQFARTPFYQHKRLFFIDSLRMVWERNDGFDTIATQVAGFKILGIEINGEKVSPDSFNINFHWWSWLDMVGSVNDINRYNLMSDTTRDPDVDDFYVAEHGYPDPIALLSIGPFEYLTSTDSITFVIAFVGGENIENLLENVGWAQKAYDSYYILPGPPPSPLLNVIPGNQMITLYWDRSPERAKDPSTGKEDFEGYRIYRRVYPDTTWILLAQFDIVDSLSYNTGLPDTMREGQYRGWRYYVDRNLRNGFVYEYSVTSFDQGDPELDLPSLESSIRLNATSVTPGTPPTSDENLKVGVYPNPYRVSSLFDQPGPWGRVLRFYNLPERATIYIYNLAGDLVKTIHHENSITGEATWDLISDREQPVATGLYIFVVKNLKTGKVKRGKFLIIK